MKIAIVFNSTRCLPTLMKQLEGDDLKIKHNIDFDLITPKPDQLEATLKNLNLQTYNRSRCSSRDSAPRNL
jgi:hypothetical protein